MSGGWKAEREGLHTTAMKRLVIPAKAGILEIGHYWRCPARLAEPTFPCRSRQPGAIYTIEDESHVSLTICQRNVSFGLISPRNPDSFAPVGRKMSNLQVPAKAGIQCRLYASWIPVLVFTGVTFFRRNDTQRWVERQFEMSGFFQSRHYSFLL